MPLIYAATFPVVALLLGCSGPGQTLEDSGADVEVVFSEAFDGFPGDGRWSRNVGPDRDNDVGNPAPSVVFPNEGNIDQQETMMFDGRTLTITMDVRIDPRFVGATDIDLSPKDATNGLEILFGRLRHVGNQAENDPVSGYPAGMSTWIICGQTQLQVPTSAGFHAMQLELATSGFSCSADGVAIDEVPMPIEPKPVELTIAVIQGVTSIADVNVDNVLVVRPR